MNQIEMINFKNLIYFFRKKINIPILFNNFI